VAPIDLLLEADPSLAQIQTYLPTSTCYVAEQEGQTVGVYLLMARSKTVFELMNIAIRPILQGQGLGTLLLNHAISMARELGAQRLEVGTGTFGDQLRFYQRAGFRVYAVDRDFFLDHYAEPVFEDGLQHKDMLRLAIDF